ncbi:sensor histidine kinase [Aeromonas schubertii]|uniref:sensor histidine kinase n=1 Tax=Aeromonas schubertii TaxID=652 RepID=UPI0010A82EFB|nr:sensor histidine kinase [Aeromonas schubertii]QCG48447.1 HAMP domain-containing protein [Aeromonas schubertii]
MMVLWALSTWSSYHTALAAATQAYDRTLLASARTVAERLDVAEGRLRVDVPYVVLDSFERNMRDRLYYQVRGPSQRVISGYEALPVRPADTPLTDRYPALAYFYDGEYQGAPIRAVALLQPVNQGGVSGMATITVAETLLGRRQLAEQLLWSAFFSQGALLCLTWLIAYLLLKRLLTPMRRLSRELLRRDAANLAPLPDLLPWQETRPLILAFNRHLERLRQMVTRQERFSADAAHQLRTPLAVLKTQVAVAQASTDPKAELVAMVHTLDRTIGLTERLLTLARLKADECAGRRTLNPLDLVALVQEACFSRLTAARTRGIDLGYEGEAQCMVPGEPLLLGELCANLIDNAIKYTPARGMVTVRVRREAGRVWLEVEDSGPGIAPDECERAAQPFVRLEHGGDQPGAGLGLALVRDIAHYHGSGLSLERGPSLGGLLARVGLGEAAAPSPTPSHPDLGAIP